LGKYRLLKGEQDMRKLLLTVLAAVILIMAMDSIAEARFIRRWEIRNETGETLIGLNRGRLEDGQIIFNGRLLPGEVLTSQICGAIPDNLRLYSQTMEMFVSEDLNSRWVWEPIRLEEGMIVILYADGRFETIPPQ